MKLFSKALTYLASGLSSQGLMFAFWMLLPWFITPAELGYVTVALFVVETLTVLCMVGMDAALIRFSAEAHNEHGVMLNVALSIALTAFLFTAGVVYFALQIDTKYLASSANWVAEHYGLVVLVIASNVFWNLYQSYQLGTSQAKKYAIMQILRACLYLGLGVALLKLLGSDASVVVASSALSALIVMLFFIRVKLPMQLATSFRDKHAAPMLKYGFPLMLYALMGVGVAYTQRLVVDYYSDIATLGIFSFFNVIVMQLNGLWGSLNKAWTPQFFSMIKADRNHALDVLRGMFVMVCVAYPAGLAIFVLIGDVFLNSWIFPVAYLPHISNLYLLLAATLFTGIYTVVYPLIYLDHNTSRILAISACMALVNLGIAILSIRAWGMIGAALSFAVLAIFTMWVYLLSYRDWAENSREVIALLIAVTFLVSGAGGVLIVTHSAGLFAVVMLVVSAISLGLGGKFVKHILLDRYNLFGSKSA